MREAAGSRFTQLHEGTPGLAWWRDRAVRRKSISGASATGPVSRRATSAPSHRADEPPGPQAPGKQARLVDTDRTDRSGRGARMRCPGFSVLCLSPPLVALLLTRLAIRSGQSQSHPGLHTQPHQPGSGRRVTALARSDHSAATEEPAPSLALPPTSVHVIVRCGDTPVLLRSLGDRCERNKRASRAWSARLPASPKGRIESEPRGPSQLRGLRKCMGSERITLSQLRIATIRHGLKVPVLISPCFGHFGWPFPSQDGPPGKKGPLGIRLKSTRPSENSSSPHKKIRYDVDFFPMSRAVAKGTSAQNNARGAAVGAARRKTK